MKKLDYYKMRRRVSEIITHNKHAPNCVGIVRVLLAFKGLSQHPQQLILFHDDFNFSLHHAFSFLITIDLGHVKEHVPNFMIIYRFRAYAYVK